MSTITGNLSILVISVATTSISCLSIAFVLCWPLALLLLGVLVLLSVVTIFQSFYVAKQAMAAKHIERQAGRVFGESLQRQRTVACFGIEASILAITGYVVARAVSYPAYYYRLLPPPAIACTVILANDCFICINWVDLLHLLQLHT